MSKFRLTVDEPDGTSRNDLVHGYLLPPNAVVEQRVECEPCNGSGEGGKVVVDDGQAIEVACAACHGAAFVWVPVL